MKLLFLLLFLFGISQQAWAESKTYALLISVSKYKGDDNILELNNAIPDMFRAMVALKLRNNSKLLCVYVLTDTAIPPEIEKKLNPSKSECFPTNKNSATINSGGKVLLSIFKSGEKILPISKPTVGHIRNVFTKLMQIASAEDTVVIYFIGHGYSDAGENNAFPTLIAYGDNDEGAIIKKKFGTHLLINKLLSIINSSGTRSKIFLFFDICRTLSGSSAKIITAPNAVTGLTSGLEVGMFLSSSENTPSYPFERKKTGFYSYYLTQALINPPVLWQGKLTSWDLDNFLTKKLKGKTPKNQTPSNYGSKNLEIYTKTTNPNILTIQNIWVIPKLFNDRYDYIFRKVLKAKLGRYIPSKFSDHIAWDHSIFNNKLPEICKIEAIVSKGKDLYQGVHIKECLEAITSPTSLKPDYVIISSLSRSSDKCIFNARLFYTRNDEVLFKFVKSEAFNCHEIDIFASHNINFTKKIISNLKEVDFNHTVKLGCNELEQGIEKPQESFDSMLKIDGKTLHEELTKVNNIKALNISELDKDEFAELCTKNSLNNGNALRLEANPFYLVAADYMVKFKKTDNLIRINVSKDKKGIIEILERNITLSESIGEKTAEITIKEETAEKFLKEWPNYIRELDGRDLIYVAH